MTKQEKDNRVPLWERMNLTLEEAAAYKGLSMDEIIHHLAVFISNLWQI